MSCAQAHWVRSKAILRVMQLKLHEATMAIGCSLRMCARHVDSTNPGRSNLVFRSEPIPEAEMSNRLIHSSTYAIGFHLCFFGRRMTRICTHSVDPSLTHFLGEFSGLRLALVPDVVVPGRGRTSDLGT